MMVVKTLGFVCGEDSDVPDLTANAEDPPMHYTMQAVEMVLAVWPNDIDAVIRIIPVLKRALHHSMCSAEVALQALAGITSDMGAVGVDLVVAHGVVDDIAALATPEPPCDLDDLFAALRDVSAASDAYKWIVARSGALRAMPDALVPDYNMDEPAIAVLQSLVAHQDGPPMLRYLMDEAPEIVPALLQGITDARCITRDERIDCLKAMVRAAGPEERARLVATGASEALLASIQ